MNPVLETTWLLKNSIETSELLTTLESRFRVESDSPVTSNITVYDDFDASLWKSDHLLCRVNKLTLQLSSHAGSVAEVRAPAKARFWWELPDSDVKTRLKKLIGLRAVTPIASLEQTTTPFILRNSDDKIVARCQLLQATANNESYHYLTLQQMRGYKKSYSQAKKLLMPLSARQIPDFGLRAVLSGQSLVSSENDSAPALHLSPDMPAELAVRAMAAQMVQQASRHIDGIIADTDTVFLHQFRVSVRKLRSLVSLLKKTLPPATVQTVGPQLSAIAAQTSRLRDLDVFLLDKNHYRTMLPDTHEAGLDELFRLVEKQRQQEKSRVARYFSSSAYDDDMGVCITALSAEPAFETPISRKPVLSVAKLLLITRYKKIRSMSARLHAESVDDDVHEIRKELKKLRYLIEFFIELLPRKRTARLHSRLKKLQVTLGQFNDYCVQIEFLSSFNDDRQIEMTKALSGLIAILHHKQIETRNQVEAALSRFFTDEMAMEIELAFGAKASGESV